MSINIRQSRPSPGQGRRQMHWEDNVFMQWGWGGRVFRVAVVGGMGRLEERIREEWYMHKPTQEEDALLAATERLYKRLTRLEQRLHELQIEVGRPLEVWDEDTEERQKTA